MSDVILRPDADSATDGWTDQAGGTTTLYNAIDETTEIDTDYVQSPIVPSAEPNVLKVRLFQDTTQIAEWTHPHPAGTFTTVEQTLTAPQAAAITNPANLFIEFDDSEGSVYRFSLGNPATAITQPFKIRYRYRAEVQPPEWVPEGAAIHIDFLGGSPQGRAWLRDYGEVAIDNLLGADSNTEAGWGTTEYNPTKLSPNGYLADNPVAFIGPARDRLVAGCTIVFQTQASAVPSIMNFIMMSADGNDGIELQEHSDTADIISSSWGGTLDQTLSNVINIGAGARNAIALTQTSGRWEVACNGSAAVASTLDAIDRPTSNPLVAALIDTASAAPLQQSITLYDPLSSTTGLSELSAQTAPAWVPDGAVVHIDLVGGSPQGQAWVEGAGVVAVNTLLGTDPNTISFWESTAYNPAHLTPNGYVATDDKAVALIGAALTTILAGSTFVVKFKAVADDAQGVPVFFNTVDGDGISYYLECTSNFEMGAWGSVGDYVYVKGIGLTGNGAINTLAITQTHTRFEMSGNGSAVHTFDALAADVGDPFALIACGIDADNTYAIKSITLYDPLPDTAGLPALSTPPGVQPAWVPENAVIYIDFVGGTPQGRAWLKSVGEVPINTLVGNDPVIDDAWGGGSGYDEQNLFPDGYQPYESMVAYTGAARTMLQWEHTIVRRFKQVMTGTITNPELNLTNAANSEGLYAQFVTSRYTLYIGSTDGPAEGAETEARFNLGLGAVNVAATTFRMLGADAALNGSPAVSTVLTFADKPSGYTYGIAEISDQKLAQQSTTIYHALPDATGLSELSEIVHANLVIFIDFVNNTATNDGVTVAINTLVGTDANADSGYGTTTGYDPACLAADGYRSWLGEFSAIAAIGALRDKLLAGCTIVIKFRESLGPESGHIVWIAADGVDAIDLNFDSYGDRNTYLYSWSGSLYGEILTALNSNATPSATNCIAMTLVPQGRCEVAINDYKETAQVMDGTDWPSSNPPVAFLIDAEHAIASIKVYDTLPSIAGLGELAITGVPNTAPTVGTLTYQGTTLTAYSNTYTAAMNRISDGVPEGDVSDIVTMFVDAQGNPLTLSVTSFKAPARVLIDGIFLVVSTTSGYPSLAPGSYPFVLRATDPGGLYVEQTFTITVTA